MASIPNGAKFRCAGAIDNWRAACDAFTLNHEVAATCDGVSERSVGTMLDALGAVDVITGGPPCQGFSTSGKRALDDPRNSLVKAFFGAVGMARPKAFLMENVSGFTTFQGGRILQEVLELTRNLGYKPYPGIVLASLCGVPQRRRRFILVGLRSGSFVFPNAATVVDDQTLFTSTDSGVTVGSELIVDQRPGDGCEAWSFGDATSDLPSLAAGEQSFTYLCPPGNKYQAWVRTACGERLEEHAACRHSSSFVEMMSYIPQGSSGLDPEVQQRIPRHIRPKSGFANSYTRIRADEPSPTITRNFTTPSSANCIHPRENRALTLREGARCQSFPDHYKFFGTHGDKRLMIGNAVPPLLARSLGLQLLSAISGNSGD